jgi:hypothetical protein
MAYLANSLTFRVPRMRPQFARYGSFEGLEQQPEDALDFRVRTGLGFRWLELAEFAPLDQFAGDYENVSGSWPVGQVVSLVLGLIRKKANKGYGKDVILIIYKTHETFFVPPPILRTVRRQLLNNPPPFESVYYLSPHDPESASVWEIWPGDSNDDGPTLDTGSLHVGF